MGLTALLLVAIVAAIVFVIAPGALLDAPLRSVAPELVQPAGLGIRASCLVPSVSTVQISIALFLTRDAEFRGRSPASEVVRLTLSIDCEHWAFVVVIEDQ